MAQHDYVIDNQTSASLRSDLNNALAAIVSQNSGATAPASTFANQLWYDTSTDQLKQRNETDTVWITLGTTDQTNNKFEPNQTFATQAEAEARADNTKAMTALRTEQAIVSRFNATGTAPFYASRAWGVVDANGNLLAGQNVSATSGLDPTTVTFTTSMIDVNYAVLLGGFGGSGNTRYPHVRTKTTSSFTMANGTNTGGGMWFSVIR